MTANQKYVVQFGESKRTLNHARMVEPKKENVYIRLSDYSKALVKSAEKQNTIVYGYVADDNHGNHYLHIEEFPTEKYQKLSRYITERSDNTKELYPYRGKGIDLATIRKAGAGFLQILESARMGYISTQGLKKIIECKMESNFTEDIHMIEDIISRNFIELPFEEQPTQGTFVFDGKYSYKVCESFTYDNEFETDAMPNLIYNKDCLCWSPVRQTYKTQCLRLHGTEEETVYRNGIKALDAIRLYEKIDKDFSAYTKKVINTVVETGEEISESIIDWNIFDLFTISVRQDQSKYIVRVINGEEEEYYSLPNNQENWNMFNSLWIFEQKRTAAIKAVKTATAAVTIIRRKEFIKCQLPAAEA